MTRRQAAVRFVLAVMLGLAPMIGALPSAHLAPAGAQDPKASYDGLASAYGVDAVISNSSIPLGLAPEAAGPTAQAHLNNLGNSDAFASFPYPGDTVAGLPGTAGALFGVPTPAYPVIVATQAGDHPKDQDLPGVGLHAASGASDAYAQATVGASGTGFESQARVEVLSDQSVRASAQTKLGLNILNYIDISGIESSAEVTADATTGELTRTSHLSIGQISLPGLAIGVPQSTPGTLPIPIPVPGVPQLPPLNLPPLPIPLGGTTLLAPDLGFEDGSFTITLPIPLGKPLKFAIPAELVLNAFEALGIKVTYQTAQTMTTGVVAPALTFEYTAPALPANNYFNGPTDISFTLGRSTASVTLKPAQSTFDSGSGGLSSGMGSGSTTPVVASGGTIAGSGSGALSTGGASSTISTPPNTSSTQAMTGPRVATSSPVLQPVSLAVADTTKADLSGLYLTCLVIAAIVLVAASVLRLMGVRLLWGF